MDLALVIGTGLMDYGDGITDAEYNVHLSNEIQPLYLLRALLLSKLPTFSAQNRARSSGALCAIVSAARYATYLATQDWPDAGKSSSLLAPNCLALAWFP